MNYDFTPYQDEHGSIDIDALARDLGMDRLGLYTPAYEAECRAQLAAADANNAALMDVDAQDSTARNRVRFWLAQFERAAWIIVMMFGMIAAL